MLYFYLRIQKKIHQANCLWSFPRKNKSMLKNKPKRNLNLNNPVKKKIPQLPNLKLNKLLERPLKLLWMNKPKKFLKNLLKLSRLKMVQKKLNQPNLHHNKVKKKLQKNQFLNLNLHYKKLLSLKRKFNNQVNNLKNNKKLKLKKPQLNL